VHVTVSKPLEEQGNAMADDHSRSGFEAASNEERDRMMAVLAEHGRCERLNDVEGTMATMSNDCYQEHPSIGLRCEGQTACARYYEDVMFVPFPDHGADWQGMAMAKDRIVLWVRLYGEMKGPWMGLPSTGRSFSIPLVVIVEFRDDLMVGETWHYDAATLSEQLGLERTDVLAAARRLSVPVRD
jgi:predicted ester cyclase